MTEDNTSVVDRIAEVVFSQGGQVYEYLLLKSSPATPTHVVVHRRPSIRGESSAPFTILKIVRVKDLLDKEYSGDLSPVVAAFDMREHTAATDRQKRRKALEKLLDEKISARSRVAQIRALQINDPETNSLLEEYLKL